MSTTTPTVAAPASLEDARQAAIANLAGLLADLQPGLAQGNADTATLNSLVAAWPADVDPAIKPLAEILLRVIADEQRLAAGVQDVLTALQAFG